MRSDDFKVESGVGKMRIVASANRCQRLDINRTDAEIYGKVTLPTSPGNPSGASIYASLGVRAKDHQNRYHVRVEFTTGGAAKCRPQKVASGTTTSLGAADVTLSNYSGAGESVYMKMSAVGDVIKAKCWTPDEAEPSWQFDLTDTGTKPDATGDQIVARATTGSGLSGTYDVEFDDIVAYPPNPATHTYDEFERTYPSDSSWSGSSWGTSTDGDAWSEWDSPNNCANPSPADDFKVESGVGKMRIVASANRCQRLDINRTDAEIYGKVTLPTSPG